MANFKVNREFVSRLSDEDIFFLDSLYRFRCLSERLAHQYLYFSGTRKRSLTRSRIASILDMGIIESVSYGNDGKTAYFLTTLGVETLKYLRDQHGNPEPVTLSAFDLKLKPNNIRHQLRLNRFVLEFGARVGGLIDYRYYDSKHMPACSAGMMPDGMIECGDRVFFLEMDMGNECSPQLLFKWDNYRRFLVNPMGYYYGKPVTMLFILDGVKIVSQRKNTVDASLASRLIDKVTGDFEVYSGPPGTLLDTLTTIVTGGSELSDSRSRAYIALSGHGFSAAAAAFGYEMPYRFDAYIRKLSPQRRVSVQCGRIQEFLLDVWDDERLSVLHKIAYYHSVVLYLEQRLGRSMSYLVVVPSEKWLENILRQGALFQIPNVYFTTTERLNKRGFSDALFVIDKTGGLYHFSDASLNTPVFEKKFG